MTSLTAHIPHIRGYAARVAFLVLAGSLAACGGEKSAAPAPEARPEAKPAAAATQTHITKETTQPVKPPAGTTLFTSHGTPTRTARLNAVSTFRVVDHGATAKRCIDCCGRRASAFAGSHACGTTPQL